MQLASKTAATCRPVQVPFKAQTRRSSTSVACKAQSSDVDRRSLLSLMSIAGASLLGASPAQAAYGDSANVFGRVTNKSGFTAYAGENFSVLLPAKWNPSKEREFKNIVLRYEDNFDIINYFAVIVEPTDKSSIEDFGSTDAFLKKVSYLLGQQSFEGETISEGGFAPGRVASASLLDVATETDKKGKTYYKYEILTRTADGDEGGKHQLIKATVSNGSLYILKVQAGDKRWFKGTNKDCNGIINSFTVA